MKKRILFVDDEKFILDGLRRTFHAQRELWEMHFVTSGDAALAACEERSFDVVITDMRMPGMDGATLLGHIRDRFPQAARLVLSGYSESALASRAAAVAYRILAKPCNPTELRDAIERVCSLQDMFCTPEIRKNIGAIGELPSLSTTYISLSRATQDPEVSIAQVASIIESDVAMTAKVLQLVNSGFFGLAQPMTSLRTAVNYLGLETMKILVLASDAFGVFTPVSCIPTTFYRDLHRHAHRTAVIAGILPIDAKLRETAIISAMLHDVGGLMLASRMGAEFCAALHLAENEGCTQVEAEQRTFGSSHAEIGAYLLGLWGLNQTIVEAVAYHHRPARTRSAALDVTTGVYLADLLANELDRHPDDVHGGQLREEDRECLDIQGLFQQWPTLRARAIDALP